MTIDIDKLRAAHAATTQGEWVIADEVFVTTNSLPKDEYVGRAETKADALGIALAHNEFPAMLDEIERLRNASAGAYALLCEFADTINNSLEGDHPNKDEVLQWITQHEDDRDA